MGSHYLLRYNRRTGELHTDGYSGPDGRRLAMRARFDAERSVHDPDVEIVVIEAADADAIRRTHPRYFRTPAELVCDVISITGR